MWNKIIQKHRGVSYKNSENTEMTNKPTIYTPPKTAISRSKPKDVTNIIKESVKGVVINRPITTPQQNNKVSFIKPNNRPTIIQKPNNNHSINTPERKIYNQLDLSDKSITLLMISDYKMEESVKSFNRCMKLCKFTKYKFCTSKVNEVNIEGVEVIKVNPIKSTTEYSRFCIKELHKYVDTDYVLIIQYDGFIVNPDMWSDEFLNYDYIGSPVNWRKGILEVGNGGFSLRSKKLINFIKNNNHVFTVCHPEDYVICITHKNYLIKNNISIAPVEIAKRFGWQPPNNKYDNEFGCHLNKNIEMCLSLLNENIIKKNAIVGAIYKYDFNKIYPFIKSFSDNNKTDDLILFYMDLTEDTINKIKEYDNIKLIQMKCNHDNIHINCFRFYEYRDYLMNHYNEYDYIFMTDVRDVIFQKDPLNFDKNDGLSVFMEDKKIGMCSINSSWINSIYDNYILEKLKSENILCAGTILGKSNIIIKYLDKIIEELNIIKTKNVDLLKIVGPDQAIHNKIIKFCDDIKITKYNTDNGNIINIGFTKNVKIINDNIVNDTGIVNIIHQYDKIADKITRKYYK